MKAYTVKGTTDEVTTCELCGRDELKGTVVLVPLDANGNPDGDACYFGTSCAATAAGWTTREVTRRVRVAKAEKAGAARHAAMAAYQAETKAYEAWLRETYPTGSPVKEYGVAALWEQFRAAQADAQPATVETVAVDMSESPKRLPVRKLEIEPRGTVYHTDGTLTQWTRVINGTVYHFALMGPSDYWQVGPSCKVSRHPYGNIFAKTVVHEDMKLSEYIAPANAA